MSHVSRDDLQDKLRRAVTELRERKHRIMELEAKEHEPLAVVAMACRFPGDVDSPEMLWGLLREGRDATTPFPDRPGWELDKVYDPDPEVPCRSYTKRGGFLRDAGLFDEAFFGVSPREADAMDPQQRLLLETSWEALERAGIVPKSLEESRTGVYFGLMISDYMMLTGRYREKYDGYVGAGGGPSTASGRIAYTLGLQGPVITVDTACSSSLVAIHLAIQALRRGECDLALAGGVSVMATPDLFTEFSRQRALSPDGRCKAFSSHADGAGWSEGCGILLLERLSDARRRGRKVMALLRGSGVNHDGRSQGFSAPNGPSQERLIWEVLSSAGLAPSEVDAVEAHGTGTPLGDPIEAGALLATYGQERPEDAPLHLGSIKTNLGHTLAAAGVAGVMKMVLALQNEELPVSLYSEEPTQHVDWSLGNIRLLDKPVAWPRTSGRVRRAGVSSFGFSGTNAHVIIEEAPEDDASEVTEASQEPSVMQAACPLVLSGRTDEAMRANAERLARYLEQEPESSLLDVAYTMGAARTAFERRAALCVRPSGPTESVIECLKKIGRGDSAAGALLLGGEASGDLGVLFTGQGSQRAGMGRGLYEIDAVYRKHLEEVVAALDEHLERPLLEVMFAQEGTEQAELLEQTAYTQPALFALEVALYRRFEGLGVRPAMLLGHSIGELVAAHVAGVLSLEDAARLVIARGRLMQACPGGGRMVSLGATPEEVRPLLGPGVDIAGYNGPTQTVISGDAEEVEEVARHFESAGRKVRRLSTSHAFHSHHMDAALAELKTVAASCRFDAPRIPIISNVTGKKVSVDELSLPEYWARQMRSPVRFQEGVETAVASGVRSFLECGPHGVLVAMAGQCVAEDMPVVLAPALSRDEEDAQAFASALGRLFVAGHAPDWSALFAGNGARLVELPTYAFQRQHYWAKTPPPSSVEELGLKRESHPLLTAVSELPDGGLLFTGTLDLERYGWLEDHQVFGTVVVPGPALMELAAHVAARAGLDGVGEAVLASPLLLRRGEARHLDLIVEPAGEDGRRRFSLHTRVKEGGEGGRWTEHASGVLGMSEEAVAAELVGSWPPTEAEEVALEGLYERLEGLGYGYGPAFRGLKRAWRKGGRVYAEVELPEEVSGEAEAYALQPVLLDAMFHAVVGDKAKGGSIHLPFEWRDVQVHSVGARALRGSIEEIGEDDARVELWDSTGAPVVSVGGVRGRPASVEQIQAALEGEVSHLYEVATRPVSGRGGGEPGRLVVVEESGDGLEKLEGDGPAVAVVRWGSREATAEAVREATWKGVGWLQRWFRTGEEEPRAVWVTRGGMEVGGEGEPVSPALAALWGLGRTAQLEQPRRRLLLLDVDEELDERTLCEVIGRIPEGENQLVLREGELSVLRLVPAEAKEADIETVNLAPEGTVLVTGGTGGLGRVTAQHLVEKYKVKHLLLLSRSGPKAEGAGEQVEELKAAGAETVEIQACDVSDREELERVLGHVPERRPLTAVVHSAFRAEGGLLEELTEERVHQQLAVKVDAAFHLNELTEEKDIAAFVLYSSAAGVLGNAGPQGAYSAANAAVDALAMRRRGKGLEATSIAWGLWGEVGVAARERMRSLGGFVPFAPEEGLRLFDASLALGKAHLVPMHVNRRVFQDAAEMQLGGVPPLLREIVRPPARRAAPGAAAAASRLGERLASLPEAEREKVLLESIREEIAGVLSLGGPGEVPPDRPLSELGLDSIMAIEIRNRLSTLVATSLPASLLFDRPTPNELARHLGEQLGAVTRTSTQVATTISRDLDEPIAIVSMGCRYPGGVYSPDDLWDLLVEGREGISLFPDRPGWDLDRLYDPDPAVPGKTYVREGGFLHDAAMFDPVFFGISPREAIAMDPQERLLLEVSWEAIEAAGIIATSLEKSRTGVYVGVMYNDYSTLLFGSPERSEGFISSPSTVSGRIAYTFGLQGPAITVDTACSSSLVATELAIQSLRRGECDLALAGGVTVMGTPGTFIAFSQQRGLAPDGRCKVFSDKADGTAWSEGCGMLFLERLCDANRNGHRVLAIVRSGAVNQDGRSQGLTAPNGPAQEQVILTAAESAGLDLKDIDAVEAHGTGTALGDPIEAGALLATYGKAHSAVSPLYVGSLKSNIGHTQAAAGVAGLIKMVLALQKEVLPRSLFAEDPTKKVDWSAGHVKLLDQPMPWPRKPDHVRRAGVSSFGVSGTNAHIIIEEAPEDDIEEARDAPAESRPTEKALLPLVISGRDEKAVRQQASRWASWLRRNPEVNWVDVLHTAAFRRKAFKRRVAFWTKDRELTILALEAYSSNKTSEEVIEGTARYRGPIIFVFPGQGHQWKSMGRALLEESKGFAAAVDEIDAALLSHTGWSVRSVLAGTDGSEVPSLERVDVVQPALFAMSVGLAAAWRELGIEPNAVIGHSQGEVGAAYVAGAISLADAARIVSARSRLVKRLSGRGGMAVVGLPIDAVTELIEGWGGRLSVAVVNTPTSTVVSGDADAVDEFVGQLGQQNVFCKKVNVDYASHSSHVDEILPDLRDELSGVRPRSSNLPFYSTVTGGLVDGGELDGEYWVQNLRKPVRLDQALASLPEGAKTFIELSAHPVLGMPLTTASANYDGVVQGSLERGLGEWEQLQRGLVTLWAQGVEIDWKVVLAEPSRRSVSLPTYAFQRQPYWLSLSGRSATGMSEVEAKLWDALGSSDAGRVGGLLSLSQDETQAIAPLVERLAEWRRSVTRNDAESDANVYEEEETQELRAKLIAQSNRETRQLEIMKHTRQVLANALLTDVEQLDEKTPFMDLGLTSLVSLRVRNALNISLGLELAPTILFEYGDLVALVAHLCEVFEQVLPSGGEGKSGVADEQAPLSYAGVSGELRSYGGEEAEGLKHAGARKLVRSKDGWIVTPMPKRKARARLIAFPYSGGSASMFFGWPQLLGDEIELCAIQPPGRQERIHEPVPGSVEELVTALVPTLEEWVQKPCAFFGHSLGAIIAFETALAVRDKYGCDPVLLCVSGATVPIRFDMSRFFPAGLDEEANDRPSEEMVKILRELDLVPSELFADQRALMELLRPAIGDWRMALEYQYQASSRIDAPVVAFWGSEDVIAPPEIGSWAEVTDGEVFDTVFDGGHSFVERKREAIVRRCREAIEQVLRDGKVERKGGGNPNPAREN